MDTLIAGPIQAYLESQEKRLDDVILREMLCASERTFTRQLMEPREDRQGHESNTLYSHPCARKARYTYDGEYRHPLNARAVLKFLLGDIVELSVLGIARLAGLDIGLNNEELSVVGRDGMPVAVHPDGLLHVNPRHCNVEIKSCDSHTFDRWKERGGPDDTWGYLTQASMEIAAWREHGWEVDETVFVAVSTGTRQGSIEEWRMPYDAALVEAWHTRRAQRQADAIPPIPFTPEPEILYQAGKEPAGRWEKGATPRTNAKGHVYGWDVPSGRSRVPLLCTYCPYMAMHCFTDAIMEMDGEKPIWIVPAKQEGLS